MPLFRSLLSWTSRVVGMTTCVDVVLLVTPVKLKPTAEIAKFTGSGSVVVTKMESSKGFSIKLDANPRKNSLAELSSRAPTVKGHNSEGGFRIMYGAAYELYGTAETFSYVCEK